MIKTIEVFIHLKKIDVIFQTRIDFLSPPNLDKVIGWLTPHNTETCKALQATQEAVFSMQPYLSHLDEI